MRGSNKLLPTLFPTTHEPPVFKKDENLAPLCDKEEKNENQNNQQTDAERKADLPYLEGLIAPELRRQ